MTDGRSRVRSLGEVVLEVAHQDRTFWRCAATGIDCRRVPHPALAVIAGRDCRPASCRFAMYSTADLAEEASPHIIEAPVGVTGLYLLDALFHIGDKNWVDEAGLLRAVRMIAWERGDRSWAFGHGRGPFHGRRVLQNGKQGTA